MILWGGDFDHDIGGYIFSVKLTHTDVAPSASTGLASAPTLKKTTISCVKGKTIKKVTAVSPKCPSGYKKKA